MRRQIAPFVVFGGIFAIGITTVSVVAIGHCRREEPYLDPVIIEHRRRPPQLAPRPAAPKEVVPSAWDAAPAPDPDVGLP